MKLTFIDSGAQFSEDRVHRYKLWRRWSDAPTIAFLLLNPSVADAEKLDPTMRRCVQFAADHGYGGIDILNLCSFISTDRSVLRKLEHTEQFLENHAFVCSELNDRDVILAYGGDAKYARFPETHRAQLAQSTRAHHLGITSAGHPRHPLYLRASTRMKKCSLLPGVRVA